MSKPIIFKGSGVAIVTPFTADGSEINYKSFAELIEFQIKGKTDAIIVCGTTGEASTMSDSERTQLIKFAVQTVAGRVPVIAGTGSNSTSHALELSQEAEQLGVDGLLMVTPYYNKTTQKGLVAHYETIANAVSKPIIVYNVPSRTGLCVSAETAKILSNHPNIIAIKEASGNLSLASNIAALCGENLHIYSGDDDCILPILSIGGLGVISTVANIAPEDTHNICGKFFADDIVGSRAIQLKMLDLIAAIFCEVNPIPVKTALNLKGFDVGTLRLPLCEMSESNLNRLKTALDNYIKTPA
ncbi:MAG: 4-hydroxy-tetrahydrodipicolinate synthase [Clostridiales bacterium]|nr:4-hydroxy-tetrahydrodipicolinate synthase [Clostridiales bacterium]